MKYQNVWIGLAEIKPTNKYNALGDIEGGFVNMLGYARNEKEFYDSVKIYLAQLNLELIEIEYLELMDKRLENYTVDEELLVLANESALNKDVRAGRFFTVTRKRKRKTRRNNEER
jgi:hypothetical protein